MAGLEAWGLTVRSATTSTTATATWPVATRTGPPTSTPSSRIPRSAGSSASRAATARPGCPPLDARVIAANPKAFCGYSDITTLHLAIAALADTYQLLLERGRGGRAPRASPTSRRPRCSGRCSATSHSARSARPGRSVRPDDRRRASHRAPDRRLRGVALTSIGTPSSRTTGAGSWSSRRSSWTPRTGTRSSPTSQRWQAVRRRAGIVVGNVKTKASGYVTELSAEDVVEELLGDARDPPSSGPADRPRQASRDGAAGRPGDPRCRRRHASLSRRS